jgi:hypothetical protein
VLTTLLVVAGSLQAANAVCPSGEYQTGGGWGVLKIASDSAGTPMVSMDTIGANGHVCNLEGKLVGDRGIIDASESKNACFVRLVQEGDAIKVISGDESCRNYCGMRAGFEGIYFKPASGCELGAIKKTRAEFKRRYDRKQYRQALALLGPVPTRCEKTLDRMESPDIANDIAITQYKLGMRDACLKTLEPMSKDAARKDDEILADYPPADGIARVESVKAARTNLRLCRSLKTN